MHPIVTPPHWLSCVVLAFGSCLVIQLPANEQPPSPSLMAVRVVLRDDRAFSAYVDHRTDDEVLWLRLSRGSATLSTGFTWDVVRSVHVEADQYTATEFRDVAPYFASDQPLNSRRSSRILGPEETGTPSLQSTQTDRFRTKVQSLFITASVANWDRDAESDGIELRLITRNVDGEVIPIQGSMNAELFGRSYSPVRGSPPLLTLGRWSQPVPMTAFTTQKEAVCRLPFLSQNLDHIQELQTIGLLRVQLNVANQGDFFAESWVRIRTYNPIRDELLHHNEHRDAFGRYRARHW
jgi:hypothetical protein